MESQMDASSQLASTYHSVWPGLNILNSACFADKSASDKDRESWMIDQWVCLTEERNAVLVPQHGSGIPGAPPLEG